MIDAKSTGHITQVDPAGPSAAAEAVHSIHRIASTTSNDSHLTDRPCGCRKSRVCPYGSQHAALTDIVERLNCGCVVVNSAGDLLLSRSAKETLGTLAGRDVPCCAEALSGDIKRLLRTVAAKLDASGTAWTTCELDGGRPLSFVRIGSTAPCGCNLLAVVDLSRPLLPPQATLQKMFGLTIAEAKVAVAIADGRSPSELAAAMNVSTTTVRSQLAAIFEKTGTHRQAELVALLARVSIIS